ncbi:hypothetical protein H5410_056948 [Solanum commersonii]|uniref:Uncharacterized protein n=1 Tax=Solanum commersonii TaxID=4109 RepID=A0A9J5WPI1_SOLCO|nr:hypothetical protein H5410_056948 [Solanum commersonii]
MEIATLIVRKKISEIQQNITKVSIEADLSPKYLYNLQQSDARKKALRNKSVPPRPYGRIFERLVDLRRRYHDSFIAILEPFQDASNLEEYSRQSGLNNALANSSGKIWIFWENAWQGSLIENTDQHITINLKQDGGQQEVIVTAIYAKCDANI